MENLITEKEALELTISLFKQQQKQNEAMRKILLELNSDLEINDYTTIGCGSKMHKEIQAALKLNITEDSE